MGDKGIFTCFLGFVFVKLNKASHPATLAQLVEQLIRNQ